MVSNLKFYFRGMLMHKEGVRYPVTSVDDGYYILSSIDMIEIMSQPFFY